jgi:hypothetical protein
MAPVDLHRKLEQLQVRHRQDVGEIVAALIKCYTGTDSTTGIPLHLAAQYLKRLARIDEFDLDSLDEDEDEENENEDN